MLTLKYDQYEFEMQTEASCEQKEMIIYNTFILNQQLP